MVPVMRRSRDRVPAAGRGRHVVLPGVVGERRRRVGVVVDGRGGGVEISVVASGQRGVSGRQGGERGGGGSRGGGL